MIGKAMNKISLFKFYHQVQTTDLLHSKMNSFMQ
jgi:hypothetical protein